MKKVSATLVFTLIIGVSALAYGKGKPLADQQMDRISAGSAVANGESTASDSRSYEVELSDNALNWASGVNIVNAADSTVGDGVNAFHADKLHDAAVAQSNSITQKGVPCDCGTPGADLAETKTLFEAEADRAIGDAIALDGSRASSSTDESVELSDSAEAHAKAANIVNAVGSLVANGVNAASATNLNNIALAQSNVITQSAH
jgi:hypothetical protein